MKNDIPWQLLEKYFAKTTLKGGFDSIEDDQDNRLINEWLASAIENKIILEQLQLYFQTTGELPIDFIPDSKVALNKISGKLTNIPKSKTTRFTISSPWWKVAAVLLIGICGWWLVNNNIKKQSPMLTSVMIAKGSLDSIVLSDGSRIWLNAGSEIKYPEKFSSKREIFLVGEAYFEIAHDQSHPFIIHSGSTQTQVLGTKFTIRSYPSENLASVVVTEGKVSFGASQHVILTPGKKGTFHKQSGQTIVSDNENPNFMAWKTKEFNFDGQPLESVFKSLAEVYHFTYRFENANMQDRKLTAKFIQRPLDEIIQSIAVATNVNIQAKSNSYIIK
jgi:ferric-dicitrate binding protein FerR (iron transport regulator)